MKLNQTIRNLLTQLLTPDLPLGVSLNNLEPVLSNLPDSILAELEEYLTTCIPTLTDGAGIAEFLSLEDLLEENLKAVPSYVCLPFGFLTIAIDGVGWAYSVNVIDGKVYHLSFERVWEDGIPQPRAETLPLSTQNIAQTSHQTWDNILSFYSGCRAK